MLSVLALCLSLATPPDPNYLRRDHGPGTSGGGIMTQSGEVMKPGAVSLEFRIDHTQFEKFTEDEIRTATFKVGNPDHAHFDVLRSSTLETFSLAFGATENLQFGFSFDIRKIDDMWYQRRNPGAIDPFRNAVLKPEEYEAMAKLYEVRIHILRMSVQDPGTTGGGQTYRRYITSFTKRISVR